MQGFQATQFLPIPNTDYRVVSSLNVNKALTINNQGKLIINNYTGDISQKFRLFQNAGKIALVSQTTGTGLWVNQDSKDNGAQVKPDPGQHPGSWFDFRVATQGEYANKGFAIITHSGTAALSIYGGVANDGVQVVQWVYHDGPNQIWLIIPANQPFQQNSQQGFQNTQFTVIPNTDYKVVSSMNINKALTINNDGKLIVNNYTGDISQKFKLFQNGAKIALISQLTGTGLWVNQDSKDNGAQVKPDPGQHLGSWFDFRLASKGQHANKGYAIITHSGTAALSIYGGVANDGTQVVQWVYHDGPHQIWLVTPTPANNSESQGFALGINPNNIGNVVQGWGQQIQSSLNQIWGKK